MFIVFNGGHGATFSWGIWDGRIGECILLAGKQLYTWIIGLDEHLINYRENVIK